MSVRQSVQRLLAQKSGNRCAFTEGGKPCRRSLTADTPPGAETVVLGDIAHIVGESSIGPRGNSSLSSAERNEEPNLLLLCNIHHQLVDSMPDSYSVAHLQAMKEAHEKWVKARLGTPEEARYDAYLPASFVTDVLHSTLLPVEQLPAFVFTARVLGGTGSVRERVMNATGIAPPFVTRGDQLITFQTLGVGVSGPFSEVVDQTTSERVSVRDWTKDPDRTNVLVDLLGRAMNKITGRLGLQLDKEHHRYFFPMIKKGKPREVSYRPLNARRATRAVVWQPQRQSGGPARDYWYHRAIDLRFIQVSAGEWCVCLRPEYRITSDGTTSYPAEKIGSKVTRLMARTFNYDLLGDLNFWRSYLGKGQPRIVLSLDEGPQKLVIGLTLLSGQVHWPGMPKEFAKTFKNVSYEQEHDLLSWAAAQEQARRVEGNEDWESDVHE